MQLLHLGSISRSNAMLRPATALKTVDAPLASTSRRTWTSLNVTKSNLVNSQGGRTTRNIDGNVYDISYDNIIDQVTVVNKRLGLGFPVSVGADSRVTIDIEAATPVALAGPSFESLREILKGDGPGPEIVNGRAAMLGFLAIAAVELASGQSMAEQLGSPLGAAGAAALALLLTAASVAPALVGRVPVQKVLPSENDPYADGPLPYTWSPLAEKINGRLAMLGIAALLVNELIRGAPLL